jgi:hypothetical protein
MHVVMFAGPIPVTGSAATVEAIDDIYSTNHWQSAKWRESVSHAPVDVPQAVPVHDSLPCLSLSFPPAVSAYIALPCEMMQRP